MDTVARIEVAKARLEEQRAVVVAAKEAGPPCTQCRYYIRSHLSGSDRHLRTEGPYCGHLAHSRQFFDPASGSLSQKIDVTPAAARAPDGLCGPEAALFEPGSFLARWIRPYSNIAFLTVAYLWSSFILWALVFAALA